MLWLEHLFYTDTDTLYSKIFESTEESDPYSALWRFRTRLSLEHLSYAVKAKSHKILDNFLKQVNNSNISNINF